MQIELRDVLKIIRKFGFDRDFLEKEYKTVPFNKYRITDIIAAQVESEFNPKVE